MVTPERHTDTADRISTQHTSTTPSGAPESGHTVGRPADVPKARLGPLIAWITVPVLLALLVLTLFFYLPGQQANTEDRDPPRRVNDSEQSRPE